MGVFVVRNESASPAEVCICYGNPGSSGELGDGTDFDPPEPPSWKVAGWWTVAPHGGEERIGSGSGDKVWVRITQNNGPPVRPDNPAGEPTSFPIRYGPPFQFDTSEPALPGTVPGEGFYPYPVDSAFTVR